MDALDFSLSLARDAGSILMKYFGTELTKSVKTHDEDFATEADHASEAYILRAIRETYPVDRIITEESGLHDVDDAEYTWIVDPLDGTYNFSVMSENFGVMIARAKGDVLECAVAYNPARDAFAHASRGRGAYMNGKRVWLPDMNIDDKPLSVEKSDQERIRKAGYEAITNLGALANTHMTLSGERRAYASSDGFVWDIAPPALLLEEAGFVVSDFSGDRYMWNQSNQEIIAALPDMHEWLVSVLSRERA